MYLNSDVAYINDTPITLDAPANAYEQQNNGSA